MTSLTAQPDEVHTIASLHQELALLSSRLADKDAELQHAMQTMDSLLNHKEEEIVALKQQLNSSLQKTAARFHKDESAGSPASPSTNEHDVSDMPSVIPLPPASVPLSLPPPHPNPILHLFQVTTHLLVIRPTGSLDMSKASPQNCLGRCPNGNVSPCKTAKLCEQHTHTAGSVFSLGS